MQRKPKHRNYNLLKIVYNILLSLQYKQPIKKKSPSFKKRNNIMSNSSSSIFIQVNKLYQVSQPLRSVNISRFLDEIYILFVSLLPFICKTVVIFVLSLVGMNLYESFQGFLKVSCKVFYSRFYVLSYHKKKLFNNDFTSNMRAVLYESYCNHNCCRFSSKFSFSPLLSFRNKKKNNFFSKLEV